MFVGVLANLIRSPRHRRHTDNDYNEETILEYPNFV